MMTYKGYQGNVAYDDDAEIFHGEVVGLRDVVTFQGCTVEELKKAFHESVDDYLAFCKKRGESPEKPCSGKFVLRVSPALHRQLLHEAVKEGVSLNQLIASQLKGKMG